MNTDKRIALHDITLELMHQYYKGFENDPDIFMDMDRFTEFHYDADKIDAAFRAKKQALDRKDFFILCGNVPIGEICLKHIDFVKRECELSIHLQNDSVKNKGYGTQAEKLAVGYAFEVLKMNTVHANAVLKNARSQHVLEKVGFDFVRQEGIFKYYHLTREKCDKVK